LLQKLKRRNARITPTIIYVLREIPLESIEALRDLFTKYVNSVGQVISCRKSTIFAGGISTTRLQNIINLFDFSVGFFPFNYLGVPIFKGRQKACYLQPIADRVKSK